MGVAYLISRMAVKINGEGFTSLKVSRYMVSMVDMPPRDIKSRAQGMHGIFAIHPRTSDITITVS